MSSAKWRPFCLGLIVLTSTWLPQFQLGILKNMDAIIKFDIYDNNKQTTMYHCIYFVEYYTHNEDISKSSIDCNVYLQHNWNHVIRHVSYILTKMLEDFSFASNGQNHHDCCRCVHYDDVIMTTIGISNHQPHGCLLSHLFRRRSK